MAGVRYRSDPDHRRAVPLPHQPDRGDAQRHPGVRGARAVRPGVLGDLQGRRTGRVHAQPDGAAEQRIREPARRRVRYCGGGRVDGDRAVLRVLVVGRLRDDGRLRRGVAQPEEDHPAGHADRGDRTGPVLHLHLRDGAGGQRRQDVRRDLDQRVAARPVLRAGAGQPRHLPARRLQDPARHRIIRMRAGFPQRGVALPLRARSRNSFQRSAFHDRGHAPQAWLALHRVGDTEP